MILRKLLFVTAALLPFAIVWCIATAFESYAKSLIDRGLALPAITRFYLSVGDSFQLGPPIAVWLLTIFIIGKEFRLRSDAGKLRINLAVLALGALFLIGFFVAMYLPETNAHPI